MSGGDERSAAPGHGGDGDGRPNDPDRGGDDPELGPLRTDLSPVVGAVAEADAAGFVAVGDRLDADLRYLTRVGEPDGTYGVVVIAESGSSAARATLLAPASAGEAAERGFVDAARIDAPHTDAAFHDGVLRTVRTDRAGVPVGVRAAAVLDEHGSGDAVDDRRVLVPRSVPHDAAVYLERAGYDPASTPIVTDSRAVKTSDEVDRIRRAQRAAAAGMARAETMLARSDSSRSDPAGGSMEPGGSGSEEDGRPVLRFEDEPLTIERLRRAVNATLAARGVRDAGNTRIAAGRDAADSPRWGGPGGPAALDRNAGIRAGETVVIDLAPRGPDGYHGALTRTFVVDGDGGWERRAYVAVEAALEAALAEVEPGAPATTVHGEAAAELAAYGFDPNASPGEPGFTHDAGHGVGLSRSEPPSLPGGSDLRPGHVLAVEPGVYDPATGGVRLGDVVVVREDGYELLTAYPFGTVPVDRERSAGDR
ncbi:MULTISPECIES: M24 family metallopeptidase [Haloferacaceae]|uniref:M24 family metallopeptidase n=1 Tax=Halorubrum glutamatedens TaxID=2707018 RepID=A0ABD5QQ04_9EURY|nr:M24 family metallopeptidase [Halobellus captivus]